MSDVEEWRERALCKEVDPDIFYPFGSPSQQHMMFRQAVRICRECEVRNECYEFAATNKEQFGVWGGHHAWQIRRAIKGRKSA